jgi:exopolysaccharide biosynthesis polyprenyl glycosylphosphotransferase
MSTTGPAKSILDVRAPRRWLRRGALVKWSRVLLLLVSDLAALVTAWVLAGALFPGKVPPGFLDLDAPNVWTFVGATLLVMALRGLYRGGNYWRSFQDLLQSVSLTFLLLLLFWFISVEQTFPFGRSVFVGAWLLSVLLVGLGRGALKQLIVNLRQADRFRVPTFVVAPVGRSDEMTRFLDAAGYQVVGQACPSEANVGRLLEQVLACDAQEVVVSTLAYLPGLPAFYRGLHAHGVTIRWVPDSGELLLRQTGTTRILSGLPTVEVCPPLLGGFDFQLKRLIDIVLAGSGLLMLSPLLLVIAVLVKLTSPGPAFFVQERIGVRGRLFPMVKFRSMYADAEARKAELLARNEVEGPLFKLKNDPRITPLGSFLRRTSLDELPQLWNVLVGEMSLVGPRPPVPSEVARYEAWHYDRLLVLPGITGLWQISGRSDLKTFDDVVRLDLYYIQNWSLALDIEILLKTIGVVLGSKGAY